MRINVAQKYIIYVEVIGRFKIYLLMEGQGHATMRWSDIWWVTMTMINNNTKQANNTKRVINNIHNLYSHQKLFR